MPGKHPKTTRTINIDLMARVEGEGALHVTMNEGRVEEVQLRIFEPPRFFEAFLQGRQSPEVPDLVARICGICPVAYQMSAVHALERIFGVDIPVAIRTLRRLLYCAEWIESHALHVYLLHAPDFLGYESGLEMARDHAAIVQRGLRLKQVGNRLLTLLGGRSVHPVSVRLGGFSRVPSREELRALADDLLWARDAAADTVRWVSRFEFDDPEHDYTFVALRHDRDYPMNEGRIVSTRGLDIRQDEFEAHFHEEQVPYSNALQCTVNGASYLVGPLARLHLNHDRLSPYTIQVMRDQGVQLPIKQASRGIVARSLEVLQAVDEAIRISQAYEPPEEPSVSVPLREGEGMAATEAPRGLLYHRYRVSATGVVREAKIVPPTSQNQRRIEDDLRSALPALVGLSHDQAARGCEKVIRSYDPCISCATHFLRLDIQDPVARGGNPGRGLPHPHSGE